MYFLSDANKRRQFYAKLSANIELFTYILRLTSYFTVIGVIMLQFFLSYNNFFILDLGKESFYLPFSAM